MIMPFLRYTLLGFLLSRLQHQLILALQPMRAESHKQQLNNVFYIPDYVTVSYRTDQIEFLVHNISFNFYFTNKIDLMFLVETANSYEFERDQTPSIDMIYEKFNLPNQSFIRPSAVHQHQIHINLELLIGNLQKIFHYYSKILVMPHLQRRLQPAMPKVIGVTSVDIVGTFLGPFVYQV